MANVVEVPRKDGSIGYKIRFRLGGGRAGEGCAETFDDVKLAAKFKSDVEFHGHQYPPNYVPKSRNGRVGLLSAASASRRAAICSAVTYLTFGT